MKLNGHKKNRSEAGVAMLMALITLVLLSVLAGELVYQSGVYSTVVFRERDRLRATLLARSGLRLAQLQLIATKKARKMASSMGLGENVSIVDKIWQTPLILPPPMEGAGEFSKALGFEGSVSSTITGENERISINQIVWPFAGGKQGAPSNPNDHSLTPPQPGTPAPPGVGALTPEQKADLKKKNRDNMVELFTNLLDQKRQSDDAFREKYASFTGEQLYGNLAAWMDPQVKVDGDNRTKTDYYQAAQPFPYALKEAPIASDSEYHMVKGLDETLATLISDNFTVQAVSALDVNKASMLLIHSLIPELTPDALDGIEKRRKDEKLGGPFKDSKDFWEYLGNFGRFDDARQRFEARNMKILSAESSYRVVIVATSGLATRTWVAEIGPLPPDMGDTPPVAGTPPAAVTPPPIPGVPPAPPAGPVSGDSDSLNIVYLKAD